METSTGIPTVAIGSGAPAAGQSAPPTFSGAWKDFGKDMASIEQEMGQGQQPAQPAVQPPAAATATPPTPPAITAPAPTASAEPAPASAVPPASSAPATPAPEVPEKFRGLDGKLDQDKLLKSYGEAERTLKRLQNQAQPAPVAPPAAVVQPAPAQPGVPGQAAAALTPFEAQVAQDLIQESAANGYQMPQGQAIAQARIQIKLMEAKHRADVASTFSEVAQFRETLQENARRDELTALARTNPWVLTPQGQAELVKVREEQPWLNASPEPWKAATMYVLGQRALAGIAAPAGPMAPVLPIPTGAQQSAPPLPVAPAPQAHTVVPLNTPEEVAAHVKTLNPQQEAEFWKKAGYRWDTPPRYKGI